MTEDKYARERKANGDRDLYRSGKQPHDRLWSEYDKRYALAGMEEQDAILREWKSRLTERLGSTIVL